MDRPDPTYPDHGLGLTVHVDEEEQATLMTFQFFIFELGFELLCPRGSLGVVELFDRLGERWDEMRRSFEGRRGRLVGG